MIDPLDALDAASRRTVRAFMEATTRHVAEGLQELFTEDCEFVGVLSAGKLRGPRVVESHYRHAFKGVGSKWVTVPRHVMVRDRQVVLDWEMMDPDRSHLAPATGRTTLDLDDSGLISRINTEWNPRQVLGGKG